MVWLHILAGTMGLASGLVAVCMPKGQRAHAIAGQVFVGSMAVMALSGTVLAYLEQNSRSVIGGLFTFYLVTTAWLAVHTRWKGYRAAIACLAALAFLIAAYAAILARSAVAQGGSGSIVFYALVGLLALAAGASDTKQIIAPPASGRQRLARHAWRMLTALVLACAAFFLGQADEFPRVLQHMGLLMLPVLLSLLAIPYWLLRIWRGRWVSAPRAATAPQRR